MNPDLSEKLKNNRMKNKYMIVRRLIGITLLVLFLSNIVVSKGIERKPNIVFILVDDLGYSDVGYMNQKPEIKTPHIDQLASEGMMFTNAYASCPVCSPTRASILTGKYPAKLKLTCHIPGMGMGKYFQKMNEEKKLKEAYFLDRLPLEEVTIAELLKNDGYKTAFIGKWHLAGEGSAKTKDGVVDANFHPDNMGFDLNIGGCAYGQPKSYFSPYGNATITDGEEGEYLTDRLANESVKFINENSDKPFFLMLSTYTVHTPLRAPQQTIDKYGGNTYFAMIEELDKNVGKVLDAIKLAHLEDNTLVVFYADNGGLWGNPPLRGIKGSLFEGGIKVPMIVRWPGKVTAGSVSNEPVTSVDILPTMADVANVKINKESEIDGLSLVPHLTKNKSLKRDAIYWHFPHHRNTEGAMGAAIRSGDWKLIQLFEEEKELLFNLNEDPTEQLNLADEKPEKLKELTQKLTNWQNLMNAEMPKINKE